MEIYKGRAFPVSSGMGWIDCREVIWSLDKIKITGNTQCCILWGVPVCNSNLIHEAQTPCSQMTLWFWFESDFHFPLVCLHLHNCRIERSCASCEPTCIHGFLKQIKALENRLGNSVFTMPEKHMCWMGIGLFGARGREWVDERWRESVRQSWIHMYSRTYRTVLTTSQVKDFASVRGRGWGEKDK